MNLYAELMDISAYSSWTTIKPIQKGWSNDAKYCVEDDARNKFLLRVSNITLYEEKKKEYETVQSIAKLGLSMSMPIDFGVCSEGKSVYSLLTWVEGSDADVLLPTLDKQKQYELGLCAGQALREIHSLPAPPQQPLWAERFNRKIDKKIENYKACGLKVMLEDKILHYIEEHRALLNNRPQTLQHGDYHVGNMIITPGDKLAIIDFNRIDYGDPWEEFNRIVWSVHVSKPFAVGQVHGYFEHTVVPDAFFQLMALYIASNAISSIPWAIPFGEAEVKTMLRNIDEMMDYYSGFETYIPSWYDDNPRYQARLFRGGEICK
jgi:aminoglycoside phosphotransferase (APT) family kinase protein